MDGGMSIKDRLAAWGKATEPQSCQSSMPSLLGITSHDSSDCREDMKSISTSKGDYSTDDASLATAEVREEPQETVERTYAGSTRVKLKKVDIVSVERRSYCPPPEEEPTYSREAKLLRPVDIDQVERTKTIVPMAEPAYRQISLRKAGSRSLGNAITTASKSFDDRSAKDMRDDAIVSPPDARNHRRSFGHRNHRRSRSSVDSYVSNLNIPIMNMNMNMSISTSRSAEGERTPIKAQVKDREGARDPQDAESHAKADGLPSNTSSRLPVKLNKVDIAAVEQQQNIPQPKAPLYKNINLRKVHRPDRCAESASMTPTDASFTSCEATSERSRPVIRTPCKSSRTSKPSSIQSSSLPPPSLSTALPNASSPAITRTQTPGTSSGSAGQRDGRQPRVVRRVQSPPVHPRDPVKSKVVITPIHSSRMARQGNTGTGVKPDTADIPSVVEVSEPGRRSPYQVVSTSTRPASQRSASPVAYEGATATATAVPRTPPVTWRPKFKHNRSKSLSMPPKVLDTAAGDDQSAKQAAADGHGAGSPAPLNARKAQGSSASLTPVRMHALGYSRSRLRRTDRTPTKILESTTSEGAQSMATSTVPSSSSFCSSSSSSSSYVADSSSSVVSSSTEAPPASTAATATATSIAKCMVTPTKKTGVPTYAKVHLRRTDVPMTPPLAKPPFKQRPHTARTDMQPPHSRFGEASVIELSSEDKQMSAHADDGPKKVKCSAAPAIESPVPSYAKVSLRRVDMLQEEGEQHPAQVETVASPQCTPIKEMVRLKKVDIEEVEAKLRTAHLQNVPPEPDTFLPLAAVKLKSTEEREAEARQAEEEAQHKQADASRLASEAPLYSRNSLRKVADRE